MEVLGKVLFAVGAVLLLIFGVIGIDTGTALNFNVVNLGGLILGMSLMISGAIFTGCGYLGSIIQNSRQLAGSNGSIAGAEPKYVWAEGDQVSSSTMNLIDAATKAQNSTERAENPDDKPSGSQGKRLFGTIDFVIYAVVVAVFALWFLPSLM